MSFEDDRVLFVVFFIDAFAISYLQNPWIHNHCTERTPPQKTGKIPLFPCKEFNRRSTEKPVSRDLRTPKMQLEKKKKKNELKKDRKNQIAPVPNACICSSCFMLRIIVSHVQTRKALRAPSLQSSSPKPKNAPQFSKQTCARCV